MPGGARPFSFARPVAAICSICLAPSMTRRKGCLVTLAVLIALVALPVLVLLARLPWPISDQRRLGAIRAEAYAMMAARVGRPSEASGIVPANQWPATIAGLHPEFVIADERGVEIVVKAFFGGGWGYHVARSRRDLPMLDGCYSEISQDVYWHGPC